MDCLRDLFLTDPFEDKNALKRKKGNPASGTCEWILGMEDLTAWLASGSSEDPQNQTNHVLWLYGNPGTGKSTMAIFLAEELSKTFSATDGKTLAYFFCDSDFDNRKTATSIVRGLLLQLVQQHPQLLDYLLPKYNERGAKVFESFDALWPIFTAAAGDKKTGRKYCIIDALDECDKESQETLLRQFEETFLAPDTASNIRILVTSRPYPEKKHYTGKVKTQISEILRDKAKGTFLWVGLAAAELKDVQSKDAVQVLQNMPRGLDSLYKRLLDTALEKQRPGGEVIQRVLSFIVVCLRPLSVSELSEACRLYQEEEDGETRIQFTREQIASCRLMIIIQDEKVLLLHQSVKDYLVGAGAGFFIDELKAHADLAYRSVDLLIEQSQRGKQPDARFLHYADLHWADHAHKAESKFEVKDWQVEFFEVDSPCREQWLRRLRSEHRLYLDSYRAIPQRFSILHVAAWWGIPALVHYAIQVNHQRQEMEEPASYIDPNVLDNDHITPLEQAARAGHQNVFSVLLALGCKTTTRTVEATAGNSKNGKEVMSLLLDRRGDQITITEEVVKAAARNRVSGEEVMALLLDRQGDQIIITEEVVKVAAENLSGEKVMALLLDRRGDQIIITEEVVKVAAENLGGEKVMALLLDRRGDQITITEEVVKAAARNRMSGEKVMALLLNRRGDQITITEEVVKAAAGNWGSEEVMALLLDWRGDQITITEKVVKAAAGNRISGEKVMALLLNRRGDQITITEEVVKAAAGNWGSEKVMALLLNRRGDQITITEEVVKAAAGNHMSGEKVMALLLNRQGDQITITEEVVKAAAGNDRNGTG